MREPFSTLSISLQAAFINEFSGQVFTSNGTRWVLSNHKNTPFNQQQSTHLPWVCPVFLQPPWGILPGTATHWLFCVGLLAEPGGSARNDVDLHGSVLRAAATHQPLEMRPIHQQGTLQHPRVNLILKTPLPVCCWRYYLLPKSLLITLGSIISHTVTNKHTCPHIWLPGG